MTLYEREATIKWLLISLPSVSGRFSMLLKGEGWCISGKQSNAVAISMAKGNIPVSTSQSINASVRSFPMQGVVIITIRKEEKGK